MNINKRLFIVIKAFGIILMGLWSGFTMYAFLGEYLNDPIANELGGLFYGLTLGVALFKVFIYGFIILTVGHFGGIVADIEFSVKKILERDNDK